MSCTGGQAEQCGPQIQQLMEGQWSRSPFAIAWYCLQWSSKGQTVQLAVVKLGQEAQIWNFQIWAQPSCNALNFPGALLDTA